VAASVVTSLLAACGPSTSAGPTSATGIGAPAPMLAGPTLVGGTFDLAAERGHPVVVNFWASWCVPCRNEFPVLGNAETAHADDGLVIVGVLFEDDVAPATAFVDEFGAEWPNLPDPDGTHATAYRVVAPPQTYFVDEEGILRGIQIGELTAEDFERQYAAIAPTADLDATPATAAMP
jgi:cytochrome c biogenesis protein CcmG/thiol:disulfide interchange protein DsbE